MRYVKKTLFRSSRRGTPASPWRRSRDADRDHWYTAQEAKEYGFVDHVVSSAQENPRGHGRAPDGRTDSQT